jgi:trehalose synthase
MDPQRFESVLSPAAYEVLLNLIDERARTLRGHAIWNVNSTSKGGGVVELLQPLLGYARGAGIDARWVVVAGNPEFFQITKRLHNRLHGIDGDGGELGDAERTVYERTLAANARELVPLVRAEDVVILHDPQTAALVEPVLRTGAAVIWRCHVGLDEPNDRARAAWRFLQPYVLDADAYVFSRRSFAWDNLPADKLSVIPPSIDAFSAKNADQTTEQTLAILSRAGLVATGTGGPATFTRGDGSPGRVDRAAAMIQDAPLSADDRLVVQVSRWDQLKDPIGVMHAFAEHVAGSADAYLVLAGPATESVADDPEGQRLFAAVREDRSRFPPAIRRRVHLASLPLDDVEENAAIVNALQRHAEVVTQKSLGEGFGLTVAEAMWKRRPVVASRIGGIQDQIVDGESGLLIDDPRNLAAFGAAIVGLLADPERARRMGVAAHERVRTYFLGPESLERYYDLINSLLERRA